MRYKWSYLAMASATIAWKILVVRTTKKTLQQSTSLSFIFTSDCKMLPYSSMCSHIFHGCYICYAGLFHKPGAFTFWCKVPAAKLSVGIIWHFIIFTYTCTFVPTIESSVFQAEAPLEQTTKISVQVALPASQCPQNIVRFIVAR